MATDRTYLNCRCPHCKTSLDAIAITTSTCPLCNELLDPRSVWLTRRVPGEIILPGWLRAFGWPFLLLLAGAALTALSIFSHWPIPLKLPAFLIAVGLVYFLVKLLTDGEEF